MRPESTSVVFRPDLTAQVEEYMAEKAASRFLAPKVAPLFKSGTKLGQYPLMNRENFKKPATGTKRAPGAAYNRIQGKFGRGTYACEENGLEYPIDDSIAAQYGSLFNAEKAGTMMTWFQIMLAWEIRAAGLYTGAGHTNHNVTTAWSTVASAVPLDDIATGVETLEDKSGAGPEDIALVIPRADFREMLRTTQVKEKLMYTYPGIQPAQIQPQQMAAMLGIKAVHVARSVYDSTEEGYAESNSQIWTAGVMYLSVLAEENAPLETPSATRTILWTADGGDAAPIIESYREDKIRSDIVRVRMDTDEVSIGEADLFVYQLTNT